MPVPSVPRGGCRAIFTFDIIANIIDFVNTFSKNKGSRPRQMYIKQRNVVGK